MKFKGSWPFVTTQLIYNNGSSSASGEHPSSCMPAVKPLDAIA